MNSTTVSLSSGFSSVPRCASLLLIALLSIGPVPSAHGQADDGVDVSLSGGDALTVDGLLQTDAYFGRAGSDGFRARTTRLGLSGAFDEVRYRIQTDFSSPSVLLDAFARLPLTDRVRLSAGLFKTPFSGEFLTPRPDILFAERARVVNALAPNRQVGVTLGGPVLPDRLTATVGAFNGTRGLAPNDNDLFLYVGRLNGRLPLSTGQLEVGANAAYSVDDAANLGGVGRPSFTGRRFLYGVDVQFRTDRWLLEGEVDGASLDPDNPAAPETQPFGFYLGGGVTVAEDHRVLARIDNFDPDLPGQVAPEDQFEVAYSYEPSSLLKVLLNYQAPGDAVDEGFLTARLQIAIR